MLLYTTLLTDNLFKASDMTLIEELKALLNQPNLTTCKDKPSE